MQDRRLDDREPTILEGRIRIDDQDIECTVRDLSETGAQLLAPQSFDLPSEFDLHIPKRGLSFRAQIVWSKDRSHGIRFVRGQSDTDRAAGIQGILTDARQQLARVLGIPAGSIRLRLEIDG